MTNSTGVLRTLQTGGGGEQEGAAPSTREPLADSLRTFAVWAVLRGLRLDLLVIGEMDINAVGIGVAEEETEYEERIQSHWDHMYDSTTGMMLDAKLVGIARGE